MLEERHLMPRDSHLLVRFCVFSGLQCRNIALSSTPCTVHREQQLHFASASSAQCAAADITAAAPVPRSNYTHPACTQRCGRDLLCGHACNKPCHGGTTCPPCCQPCKAACNHGRCKGGCTDACQPCAEPCAWRMVHVHTRYETCPDYHRVMQSWLLT